MIIIIIIIIRVIQAEPKAVDQYSWHVRLTVRTHKTVGRKTDDCSGRHDVTEQTHDAILTDSKFMLKLSPIFRNFQFI
jgi:hypothetical protein